MSNRTHRTLALVLSALLFGAAANGAEPEKNPLEESQRLIGRNLAAFAKTGVPTRSAVDAAFQKATTQGTIENWQMAADLANSYANIVSVLKTHYSNIYAASLRSDNAISAYGIAAADYERVANSYLLRRNGAYLEIAKLYIAKGESGNALGFAVASVELSGSEPNIYGVAIIKQIIEYSK